MEPGQKIKCPECGISVPDVPEGSTYDMLLCASCYDAWEEKEKQEKAISKADRLYDQMKEGL